MDSSTLNEAKKLFLQKLPDFESFADPPKQLAESELDYKREVSNNARAILQPYVDGTEQVFDDDQARDVVLKVINLTNFLNWRDKSYIEDQLMVSPGAWLEFFSILLECLRDASSGDWRPSLEKILNWLDEQKCNANITKILPTYFLFMWNPTDHFCVKSRFTDNFLKLLNETPLGQGRPLTVEKYDHLLTVCQDLRSALSDWQLSDNIDVHSFAWVVTGGWKKTNPQPPVPVPPPTPPTPPPRVDIALNLILAGPPGTGKTYRLLQEYKPLFEQQISEQPRDEFIQEQCGQLKWYEVCAIGLRLLQKPSRIQEIVSTDPVQAKVLARGRTAHIQQTVWSIMMSHTPVNCPHVNIANRSEPALFWKDDHSVWRLVEEIEEIAPELLEIADSIQNYKAQSKIAERHEFVTFHQSYSYEDFVEGIKPAMDEIDSEEDSGQVRYTIKPGIFTQMVRRAVADPQHSYALFIDEINRANISNVFGELITLLETDKRMRYDAATKRWTGGVQLKLPYSHSARPLDPLFGVPDNLYVIGTMNTADRSIALMDLALRRRFTFDEIMPDSELLATEPGPLSADDDEKIYLDRMLDAMNQRLEYLYDRDHTIGHSYLMEVRTLDDLIQVFLQKILPLLQEYFYGDWHKIQLVLGDLIDVADADDRPKDHPHAIVTHVIQRPKRLFGVENETFQDRRSYAVNEELSAESFRKIYRTLENG